MQRIRIIFVLSIVSLQIFAQTGMQQHSLLSAEDLDFLSGMTKAVLEQSRVYPGQVIAPEFGPNKTGGTLVRPGGRATYPAFWIRDYAMSLDAGLVS